MEQYFASGISFKPHCAIGFTFCINQQKRSQLPKLNKNVGVLSRKAKAKMNNAINWMVYLSEGKKYYSSKTKKTHALHLNFITLTLCAPQFHSDGHIKKHLLEPFLKWMKRKGNDLYVWRAETQFNGNIHFHIVSNKFLHMQSIRNKWNSLLEKRGYLKIFFDKHGHHDAISSDVVGIHEPEHMAAYMVKYMGKITTDKNCSRYLSIDDKPKIKIVIGELRQNKKGFFESLRRPVECKVWSCSTALMNKRRSVTELDNGFEDYYNYLEKNADSKSVEKFTLYFYDSKHVRNTLLESSLRLMATHELNLHNERLHCKGLPFKLGGISSENKIERPLYMPTLWSKAKLNEERQKRVLPCNNIMCTSRPQTNQSL